MYVKFNNNPSGADIDDCYIRATAKALGVPYYEVMDHMFEVADKKGWNENNIKNVAWVMMNIYGCKMYQVTSRCTVNQLANELTQGNYVFITKDHATACIDGDIYDTWNPNRYKVYYYFEVDKK